MPQTEQMPCRVVRVMRPVGEKEGFTGVTVLARNYYEAAADSALNLCYEADRKSINHFLREDGPIYVQKFAPTPEFPKGGKVMRVFNNEYIYTIIEDADWEARDFESGVLKKKPNYGRYNGVVAKA